jgi:hypothetical protein
MASDRPVYDDTSEALLARHGWRLAECVGCVIDRTWVAWNRRDNEWLADEAVLLGIGGHVLAINCWKMNEIALGWDCIDVAATPAWVTDWGDDFDLEWRSNGLDPLTRALGQRVRRINLIEYLHRTTVLRAPSNPSLVGTRNEAWLLNGIELVLDALTLTVFNALDENGVTLEVFSGAETRRVPVA